MVSTKATSSKYRERKGSSCLAGGDGMSLSRQSLCLICYLSVCVEQIDIHSLLLATNCSGVSDRSLASSSCSGTSKRNSRK